MECMERRKGCMERVSDIRRKDEKGVWRKNERAVWRLGTGGGGVFY